MESVEVLENKLKIAKKIKEINDFFDNAKCPVCGSKSIKTDIRIIGAEDMCYGEAVVQCTKCGMFKYKRDINGYEAYHWNYNGTSELNMLQELKNRTEQYLK